MNCALLEVLSIYYSHGAKILLLWLLAAADSHDANCSELDLLPALSVVQV